MQMSCSNVSNLKLRIPIKSLVASNDLYTLEPFNDFLRHVFFQSIFVFGLKRVSFSDLKREVIAYTQSICN